MRVLKVLVVFVVMTAFTASAFAERGLGGIYTKRSLTQAPSSLKILAGPTAPQLNGSSVVLPNAGPKFDAGFSFYNPDLALDEGDNPFERDAQLSLNLGAVYGITDGLEVGSMFAPLLLSGDKDADLYRDIPVWVTYGMDLGDFDLGVRVTALIPILKESDFALVPGVPFLYRGSGFRIDSGVFLPINFGENDTLISLSIPVKAAFQLTPNIFAGLSTGVSILGLSGPEGQDAQTTVPLGIFAGYTMLAGGRVIDFALSFDFDNALWLTAEEGVSTTQFSDFRLAVGGNVAIKF